MNPNIIKDINYSYQQKKTKALFDLEKRKKEIYSQIPRLKEIEDEINSQGAEISKIIISDRVDRKSAMEKLKARMDALNTEKAFLLTDNGNFAVCLVQLWSLCGPFLFRLSKVPTVPSLGDHCRVPNHIFHPICYQILVCTTWD